MKADKIVGGILVLAASMGCEKKVTIESDSEKASYSIGTQIGKNLKAQNLEVSVRALTAGIDDALQGKEARMKPEEMQAAMVKMQEDAMKKSMESAGKNLKEGDEFLEKNKSREGVKVTSSGLQYEILKEGSGKSPTDTETVRVHYTGTLIDGQKFDSSVDRGEPAEFPVNGVISGWTEALKMMKPGAKWKLVIPSGLAYGSNPRPGIPANSVLVFEVELLEVKKPGK